MTSLAADTSTWSPSKLAKVAAWEQAQFEAARKKANRRTLRSQFHKMTHRRTTSTSSSTCSASDAALQAPKLYIISGQSAEVFLIDVFLIAEVFLIDIGFKLRGQSTSVAADTWPIKYSSWSPPLLAKVSAWEQPSLRPRGKDETGGPLLGPSDCNLMRGHTAVSPRPRAAPIQRQMLPSSHLSFISPHLPRRFEPSGCRPCLGRPFLPTGLRPSRSSLYPPRTPGARDGWWTEALL